MPTFTSSDNGRMRGPSGERGIVYGPEPPSTVPQRFAASTLPQARGHRKKGFFRYIREILAGRWKIRLTIEDDARCTPMQHHDGHSCVEGAHVMCKSNGGTICRLEVINVAGDVHYEIRPERAQELLAGVQAITPSPRNIGNSSANSFILTDALGEEITLGFSSVQTFEGLKKFLVFHFDGKVGEDLVCDGRYCIVTARDGREVSSENWEEVYEAREPMIMAILIREIYESEKALDCPKCGKTKLGVMQNGGQQLCRKCNTGFFRPLTAESDELEPDSDDDLDVRDFRHIRRAGMTVEQERIMRLRMPSHIFQEFESRSGQRRRAMQNALAARQQENSSPSRFQELED